MTSRRGGARDVDRLAAPVTTTAARMEGKDIDQHTTRVDLAARLRAAAKGTGHTSRVVYRHSRRGDSDGNSAVVQRVQARIQQIHDLLVNAVVGEDPPNDGIAEPDMVLTIRYDDTGDTETFLLGVRGAEYGDMEVYSNQSPLGAAITGARLGERRTYTLPSGAALTVTLLKAVPYGIYTAEVK